MMEAHACQTGKKNTVLPNQKKVCFYTSRASTDEAEEELPTCCKPPAAVATRVNPRDRVRKPPVRSKWDVHPAVTPQT